MIVVTAEASTATEVLASKVFKVAAATEPDKPLKFACMSAATKAVTPAKLIAKSLPVILPSSLESM